MAAAGREQKSTRNGLLADGPATTPSDRQPFYSSRLSFILVDREMPQKRAYKVVDAFSSQPTKGNPVAVVLDGEGLTDAQMQAIAGWTNLSETTFVLPAMDATADYRLRIFTPQVELPFAGHPTIGTAHAMLEAGRVTPKEGVLVQECAKGLVRISIEEGPEPRDRQIRFALPVATTQSITSSGVNELLDVIPQIDSTTPPLIIDVGPRWLVATVSDVNDLIGMDPDYPRIAALCDKVGGIGITLFADDPKQGPAAIEVRTFTPADGIDEDPVCGSGNGCVAVYRRAHGMIKDESAYVASQGRKVGRDGKLLVELDSEGNITVGGAGVTTVDGYIHV